MLLGDKVDLVSSKYRRWLDCRTSNEHVLSNRNTHVVFILMALCAISTISWTIQHHILQYSWSQRVAFGSIIKTDLWVIWTTNGLFTSRNCHLLVKGHFCTIFYFWSIKINRRYYRLLRMIKIGALERVFAAELVEIKVLLRALTNSSSTFVYKRTKNLIVCSIPSGFVPIWDPLCFSACRFLSLISFTLRLYSLG